MIKGLFALRHAVTDKDTPYVKKTTDDGVEFVPSREGLLLKGSSDDVQYRLSDFGVLQIYTTAQKISEFFQDLYKGTSFGGKIVLCHSPLIRTTETEEIFKLVLHAHAAEISELAERDFQGLEGKRLLDLEAAIRDTGIFPDNEHRISYALTYSDNFDYLEDALRNKGVEVEHSECAEDFRTTLKRRYQGLRYMLKEFDGADYIIAVLHQISGIFTLAAFDLLGMPEEEALRFIKSIDVNSYEAKQKAVPHRPLDPSRFTRLGLVNHDGTIWRTQAEHNDRGHIEALTRRWKERPILTVEEKGIVGDIRRSIAHFYESRGLPVELTQEVERRTPRPDSTSTLEDERDQ